MRKINKAEIYDNELSKIKLQPNEEINITAWTRRRISNNNGMKLNIKKQNN